MKYQLVEKLSPGCLFLKSEENQRLIFDQVQFPVIPRESLRLELQKELKEIIKQEAGISGGRLIKYSGLEKYEGQLYLCRDSALKSGLELFSVVSPEQACKALLEVLNILKLYHQQGLVLNGISLGQLKQDQQGEFYLQDPLVMNYLWKLLPENYRIDTPPEVIRGKKWTEKSDLFTWGALAYHLLAGEDPFAANNLEERLDKILKIGVVPLKDLRPELSEDLTDLVMTCLEKDPRKRTELEVLYRKLAILIEQDKLTVNEAEAKEYQEKALANCRRYQTKERFWLWFRKYGIVTIVLSLGLAAFFVLTWIGPKRKPVITIHTTPAEVLTYYFKGVSTLDVLLISETLHDNIKNSFSDLVTNLYVINKAQQGVTYNFKDQVKIDFLNLKMEPLNQSNTRVKYRVSYIFKMALTSEIKYNQRVDEYILKPVSKVWRITGIKVLSEKEWNEEL